MSIILLLGLKFKQESVLETPPPPIEVTITTPPPKKSKNSIPYQIIDRIKKENEEIDENARFISDHNQKVAKNTVSKKKIDIAPKIDYQKGLDGEKSGEEGKSSNNSEVQVQDLNGVDESNQTSLSTKEFKFYTYYKRIRDNLKIVWPVKAREIIARKNKADDNSYDPNEYKFYKTKLHVVFNKDGTLRSVVITMRSGNIELDNLAVYAFHNMGFIGNPPKELITPEGFIEINWMFIVYM